MTAKSKIRPYHLNFSCFWLRHFAWHFRFSHWFSDTNRENLRENAGKVSKDGNTPQSQPNSDTKSHFVERQLFYLIISEKPSESIPARNQTPSFPSPQTSARWLRYNKFVYFWDTSSHSHRRETNSWNSVPWQFSDDMSQNHPIYLRILGFAW